MANVPGLTAAPARADFEPRIGEVFTAAHEGAAVVLRLKDVRSLGAALRAGGAFSLTFDGPHSPPLPQATYRIENAALGVLDIFVVPIGRTADGLAYEAIFT